MATPCQLNTVDKDCLYNELMLQIRVIHCRVSIGQGKLEKVWKFDWLEEVRGKLDRKLW